MSNNGATNIRRREVKDPDDREMLRRGYVWDRGYGFRYDPDNANGTLRIREMIDAIQGDSEKEKG
jgi:hypothetical protein